MNIAYGYLQFECTHLNWSAVGRITWRGISRSFHVACNLWRSSILFPFIHHVCHV